MEGNSSCTLVLCGKLSSENEVAKSLKINNSVKLPDDTNVSMLLRLEMDDKESSEQSFNGELFMNSLSTSRFGRLLVWSPRLPSTQDVGSRNFGELPIGTVYVADVQYKGRGRSKNEWESPGLPYLNVKVKWPNDLYLNGLKVGGILCTSTYRLKKFNVSAAVGLNADNRKPTTCLNDKLRELSAAAYQLRREDILAAFFNKFENFYDLFISQGFQTLEEPYYRTWLHSGQRVIIQERKEDQVVENVVVVQGLTSSGYLLAIAEDNQLCELHPDRNSFDFFKGLVRRELQ